MASGSLEERVQRLEEMENRLRVVEDIEQIKQLHVTYVNLLMDCDWDAIMKLFAEDSGADFGGGDILKGKEAIEAQFRGHVAKNHVGKEGDFVVHPRITVDGDTAKGNWLLYMMYFHPDTYQSIFWVQGYYNCEYVRENGEWKFSLFRWKRRLAPPGVPPNEEFLRNFPTQ